MKRIIIVCEGQTEQEFCKDVLQPHFYSKNILLHFPTIKKSGGGIVAWEILKKQIENHLKQDKTAIVTTLIDYYGIHDKYLFPNWDAAKKIVNKGKRMSSLENGMKDSIDASLRVRFIPYLQLHEFEGLLFNNLEMFTSQIPKEDFLDIKELAETIENFPDPEMINDTPDNAPSYRLKRIIKGYNKIVYGAIFAQSIGLNSIRARCRRFNCWITQLESI